MSATGIAVAQERVAPRAVPAPPLRVAFSWTLAGNLVFSLCQFAMLAGLAKLGNAGVVGTYALALAVSAPIFMFTNLQLRAVQATDALSEFNFGDYFVLRIAATVLGLAAVLGVTAVLHYDRSTKLVIAFVGVAKAIETFSDVIAGHLQRFERLDQVSRALMIRGIVSSASFVLAFGLSKSLAVATIALGLSFLFSISLYDFNVASRLLDHSRGFLGFSTANVKRLIVMSLPLGVVMTLASLNVNLPRYILAKTLGTSELGVFASLAYLLTAASLVVVALGQSVCTRMSTLFADQNFAAFMALLNKLLGFVAAFAVGGLVICTLLGRPIVSLLFRPEYEAHMDLLLIMVATAGVNAVASFLGFGITAARQFRVQVPIMAATAITTLLLTLFLVPRLGILGAGIALLAASTVQASSSFVVLKLTISEKQSWL